MRGYGGLVTGEERDQKSRYVRLAYCSRNSEILLQIDKLLQIFFKNLGAGITAVEIGYDYELILESISVLKEKTATRTNKNT